MKTRERVWENLKVYVNTMRIGEGLRKYTFKFDQTLSKM